MDTSSLNPESQLHAKDCVDCRSSSLESEIERFLNDIMKRSRKLDHKYPNNLYLTEIYDLASTLLRNTSDNINFPSQFMRR